MIMIITAVVDVDLLRRKVVHGTNS